MKNPSHSTVLRRCAAGSTALMYVLLAGAVATARANDNERYAADIAALDATNTTALVAGIVAPTPFDKVAEALEYSTNIGLKFVPAVLKAPATVARHPNTTDGCGYEFTHRRHNIDPVLDYENIYGFDTGLPNRWGMLGAPTIEHSNTGAFLSVRRNVTEAVPAPTANYPEQMRRVNVGERLLFMNTNDRNVVLERGRGNSGDIKDFDVEYFPMGVNSIRWEAETKLDVIFDIVLSPALWFLEWKYAAKSAVKIAKPPRFARPWQRAAGSFVDAVPSSYWDNVLDNTASTLFALGIDMTGSSLQQLTNTELMSIPTGAINRQTQDFIVFDDVPPVIEMSRQPDAFEANVPGGEFGNRHFDEIRELLRVSDNCNRPVELESEPRGTRFWPIGETQMEWCGRDLGPRSPTAEERAKGFVAGGPNRVCAPITVRVQDTRPPLVQPPPSVSLITGTGSAVDIGWAGAFDVADPDLTITNDAPATFPIGRTPVTWRAEDSSGNSASATQWVNLKPNNEAPRTLPQPVVDARSFEETRVQLQAEDGDLLDGRYDQLSFRISEPPTDGFFVAPLFPFFIEDHRQHRINPDGTYTSYITKAKDACPGTEPDQTVIVNPVYVTVNDDDVMYVMDSYFECETGGGTRNSGRIAKFSPNVEGELVFEAQFDIGRLGGDNDRHLFIDHREQLWYVQRNSDGIHGPIFALDKDLNLVRTIYAAELTEINPVTGRVQRAFGDRNNAIQAVAVDRNDVLYVSNGAKILSYDLQQRQPDNANQYLRLPPVASAPDFNAVDVTAVEPWASYHTLLSGGYTDLELDSEDNLYVSDGRMSRIWKFQPTRLSEDRATVTQAPDLVGWMGACNENLDTNVLACRTDLGRSDGFSCQDDLCGPAGGADTSGDGHGQFHQPRGIAMSPQDVLYVTDTGNRRVQRFTTDGYFAGEAVSECGGSCFVLGDFGFVTNVTVNSNFFYLLDTDNDLTHIFETTPITDIDDQTMEQTQSAFVTYRSNDNFIGMDAFDFVAYDGLEFSQAQTVDINVTRNFRAPIATPGLRFSGQEDSEIALSFSALDPDQDSLAFEIDELPEHGVIEKVGDTFIYRPDSNYHGTDTFTYVATDAPTSSPALRSAPERVVVVVEPVNDAPVWEAEDLSEQGLGFEFQLVASLKDPDLEDRHRIVIDWGNGEVSTNDTENVSIGSSPGKLSVIADHVYSNPGDYTVTLCASEVTSASIRSCSSPDVTSRLTVPVSVSKMVDLDLHIEDSLPKTPDPEVPEIQVADPLMDGGERVTYSVTVSSKQPADESEPLATGVRLTFELAAELELWGIRHDAGDCTFAVPRVTCDLGDLAAGDQTKVDITVVGDGRLFEERLVTLKATVVSNEPDHSDDNEGATQVRLVVNPELDADGDGVKNADDAFPGNSAESVDTDGDGKGNNADRDDDNDGLPDTWERRFGLNALDGTDATLDGDGDGLTNELEFMVGTHPGLDDSDRDGVTDDRDNCPVVFNRNQFDANADFNGDLCDPRDFAAAASVGDPDGDGIADAVLLRTADGVTTAYVKGGESDDEIAVFQALAAPDQVEQVLALPAESAGGTQGLGLIYTNETGGIHARVFDIASGNQRADFPLFDNQWEIVDAAALGTAGGTTLFSLAVNDDGRTVVAKHSVAEGTDLGRREFLNDAHSPLGLAPMHDSGAVVMGFDADGALVAQAKNIDTGAELGHWLIRNADWFQARMVAQERGFAVLTADGHGPATVSLWEFNDKQSIAEFAVLDDRWTALDFAVGVGATDTVSVLAGDDNGGVQVRTYDSKSGAELNSLDYFSERDAPRSIHIINAPTIDDVSRITVLGSDGNGDVRLEQRNARTGEAQTTLTAESIAPPAPPPPPPPPPPPGPTVEGGGGGGGVGWSSLSLLLLALACKALTDSSVAPHCPSEQG